ncbi:uncharacterized protein [Parasteatoda tepidariorum]|uniref:uncharacterized protein n=1 Tax=Parasteatoda tepidariorum TaxID=114398 RepID=UPI001C71B1E8|nr:uncharacterized protein LOC107450736 [Parasteatoda tepidariorum]
MKCALVAVVLVCTICINFVNGDDCSGLIKSFLKKQLDLAQSGQVECATRLALAQYHCGGDPERRKTTFPKFVEFMKSKSDEEKQEVNECFMQLGKKAMDEINIPANCQMSFEAQLAEMKKEMQKHLSK